MDSHEVCKHVLDYWKRKRKELGKPLLRRYWPLTNVNDPNPNLVFRPRCKVWFCPICWELGRALPITKEEQAERRDSRAIDRAESQPRARSWALRTDALARAAEAQEADVHLRDGCGSALSEDEPLRSPSPHLQRIPSLLLPHAQLKDLFVYEGRTSSILSTTSSANAYSTFNPMISHSFGENYFGGVGMMDEPDELASLSAASQPRLTPDELQYLQLLAASQQDTREEPSYETPALIVNRAGSTETSGTNWLLPVAAKDNYEHFFTSTLNTHSFLAFSASQPLQTRL